MKLNNLYDTLSEYDKQLFGFHPVTDLLQSKYELAYFTAQAIDMFIQKKEL